MQFAIRFVNNYDEADGLKNGTTNRKIHTLSKGINGWDTIMSNQSRTRLSTF